MGFKVNPYDPCVVNKMVNGSHMMVRWHVDDLRIIHSSNKAISPFSLCVERYTEIILLRIMEKYMTILE